MRCGVVVHGPAFFQLDTRFGWRLPMGNGNTLDLSADVFNLTNRVNPLTRNTNFGAGSFPSHPSSTFNQITAVGDPRSVQLGLRLTF